MKELRIILLQAVWGLAMLKAGDLLPLSEARKVNPEYFTPGIVSPLNIKGENGYVVCVFGNRDFASESDEEILSYLKIRAKKDILTYLQNTSAQSIECNIEKFKAIYKWNDGDLIYASYYIPISGIQENQIAKNKDAFVTLQKSSPQSAKITEKVDQKFDNTNELKIALKQLEDDFIGSSLLSEKKLLDYKEMSLKYDNIVLRSFLNLKENPSSEKDLNSIAINAEKNANNKMALSAYLRLREVKSTNHEEIDFKIASLNDEIGNYIIALEYFTKFKESYRTSKKMPHVLKKISELQFKIK
jgi:hypothetical protein